MVLSMLIRFEGAASLAMRRETGAQGDLVVTWSELPRSPGHAFYDRLQSLLLCITGIGVC